MIIINKNKYMFAKIKKLYGYKLHFVLLVLILSLAWFGALSVSDHVSNWLLEHNLPSRQSHISVINQAVAQTTASVSQERVDINKLVYTVYGLESTWGKNDSCLHDGLVNGYGLGVYGARRDCYATHGEVTTLVENWFKTRLEYMTVPQALCYYNTGKRAADCNYYQNYLKLYK